MFRITTSPAGYSNSTTRPAVITHRPSCSCIRRSRGSGMPSRIAATAADMPLSYQSFKKYAQESTSKTACHRPMAVLSPEIWALDLSFDDFIKTSSDPRHKPGVEKLWLACAAQGDFYKKSYSGLYCV